MKYEAEGFEEELVAALAVDAGCLKTTEGSILPPPASCPGHIHTLYSMSQWHALTILITGVFFFFILAIIVKQYAEVK